jgi:hypothetical protein
MLGQDGGLGVVAVALGCGDQHPLIAQAAFDGAHFELLEIAFYFVRFRRPVFTPRPAHRHFSVKLDQQCMAVLAELTCRDSGSMVWE